MQPKLNSFIQVIDYFQKPENCKKFIIQQRWNGEINCPHCSSIKIYETNRGFKCAAKRCAKKFTITTGTVMENTKLPLRYWLITIYLATSAKNGISAAELSRHLSVTGKTAWFLLQRVRAMFEEKAPELLEGTVQLDETFVGGKNKNRHADKKVKGNQGRSFKDKTPVMGMLQQEVSEVIERQHKKFPDQIVKEKKVISEARLLCFVVPDTKATSIQPNILKHVKPNSTVISDEWHGYTGLNNDYWHYVVDHGRKQYVSEAGHTSNALEGAWSIFKKAIIGTHHKVTRKHLQLYTNEFTFRYNTKRQSDVVRFTNAVALIENARITYRKLVA